MQDARCSMRTNRWKLSLKAPQQTQALFACHQKTMIFAPYPKQYGWGVVMKTNKGALKKGGWCAQFLKGLTLTLSEASLWNSGWYENHGSSANIYHELDSRVVLIPYDSESGTKFNPEGSHQPSNCKYFSDSYHLHSFKQNKYMRFMITSGSPKWFHII